MLQTPCRKKASTRPIPSPHFLGPEELLSLSSDDRRGISRDQTRAPVRPSQKPPASQLLSWSERGQPLLVTRKESPCKPQPGSRLVIPRVPLNQRKLGNPPKPERLGGAAPSASPSPPDPLGCWGWVGGGARSGLWPSVSGKRGRVCRPPFLPPSFKRSRKVFILAARLAANEVRRLQPTQLGCLRLSVNKSRFLYY